MSPLAAEVVQHAYVRKAVQVPHREMLADWGSMLVFLGPGDWHLTDNYGVEIPGFRVAEPTDWIIKEGNSVVDIVTDKLFRIHYRMLNK